MRHFLSRYMNPWTMTAAALLMSVLLTGCAASAASDLAGAGLSGTAPAETALPVSDAESPYGADPEAPARYEPYSGSGPLLPRDDYGILLPYVGDTIELYDGIQVPLFGLNTADGRAVTDPVYTGVKRHGPFLLLESAAYTQDGFGETVDACPVTAAAADGHWVMDAGDWAQWLCLEDRLVSAREDGSVVVLDPDGETAAEFPRAALAAYLGADYFWGRRDTDAGMELDWAGGSLLSVGCYDESAPEYWRYACFLDMDTGDISAGAPDGWTAEYGWGALEETPAFAGYDGAERVEDLVTGAVYYCVPEDGGAVCDLLDAAGQVVLPGCFTASPLQWAPFLADGLLGAVEDGAFRYVRVDTGETVFRCALDTDSAYDGAAV